VLVAVSDGPAKVLLYFNVFLIFLTQLTAMNWENPNGMLKIHIHVTSCLHSRISFSSHTKKKNIFIFIIIFIQNLYDVLCSKSSGKSSNCDHTSIKDKIVFVVVYIVYRKKNKNGIKKTIF
jgi:hypothetical protein